MNTTKTEAASGGNGGRGKIISRYVIAGAVLFGLGLWCGETIARNDAALLSKEQEKERVTGIGGIFFKAKNPKQLRAWYSENLGVKIESFGAALFFWRENDSARREGVTVWGVFPDSTRYFGAATNRYMINYRVANLDRMLAQLRAAGVTVDERVEEEFNGRFGWATDPEGNRIELWEPK